MTICELDRTVSYLVVIKQLTKNNLTWKTQLLGKEMPPLKLSHHCWLYCVLNENHGCVFLFFKCIVSNVVLLLNSNKKYTHVLSVFVMKKKLHSSTGGWIWKETNQAKPCPLQYRIYLKLLLVEASSSQYCITWHWRSESEHVTCHLHLIRLMVHPFPISLILSLPGGYLTSQRPRTMRAWGVGRGGRLVCDEAPQWHPAGMSTH